MIISLLGIAAGALATFWLAGGSWGRVGAWQPRFGGIIVGLFLLQGVARGRLPVDVWRWGWSVVIWASCVVAIITLLLGLHRGNPGAVCMSLGLAANLLVVLINGGMPVTTVAGATWRPSGDFYHAATSADMLVWLGDALPAGDYMLSAGDVLLVLGAFVYVLFLGAQSTANDSAAGAQAAVPDRSSPSWR